MKKIFFLILAVATATIVKAQPDTLDYDNAYYREKRNLQEGVAVRRDNIVMLGNSLTERGLWAEYFQKRALLNRGIGGDCISGMIARIDPIVAGQPKAIFILGGVNDLIFSTITPEHLCDQYARLLDIIRAASPRTKVYIQSLLPLDETQNTQYFTDKNARIVVFNALLWQLAVAHGLTFIDLWSRFEQDGKMPKALTVDGIHLDAVGYAIWVEALKPYIK